MSIADLDTAAEQFTPEQKRRLLARLAFELTIAARATYVPGSDDVADPRGLRAFNEIQHRVTSSLVQALESHSSENWLWGFIRERADGGGISADVDYACSRAVRSVMTSGQ